MRLVYKANQQPVMPGDKVALRSGDFGIVDGFRTPHKPDSEGKVELRFFGEDDPKGRVTTVYVSVIAAEWIEREDRAERVDALAPVPRYSIDLENYDDGVRVSLRNVPDRATTSAQEYALALMKTPGDWRITGIDREASGS